MNTHISIIIPVYHESAVINHTLKNLYNNNTKINFEIIVVDGSKENDTINAIYHKQVKKISSPKGRGIQMNMGAELASGKILLFLHADTCLPDKGLEQVCRLLSRQDIIAGAFDLGINSVKKIYRIIEKTASIRSRFTRIPYGDQALFIKKDYFFNIRGFQNIPVMEDVDIMRRIKKNKSKIIILPLKVLTSPRRWETEGILYGTIRNWMLMIFYFIGVRPGKLADFYKYKPVKKIQ
ncbi:Transferase 2, rSAM/selenodomain-associated [Desulfonema limicola]|uniref:Transferase 2, rSAM/selenodomain-associated n=1 Tax=Desulfonema limicola TaxID=45656 RepID=A0A975BDN0_9BACT|nr:TIGR04283 family arsenosugar biosynthesis glycosyltransferase [Desulfonema limicola]QTA83734.1 Transferase 2, rSAM/selenodomain-associated [Desulfonema limicola]